MGWTSLLVVCRRTAMTARTLARPSAPRWRLHFYLGYSWDADACGAATADAAKRALHMIHRHRIPTCPVRSSPPSAVPTGRCNDHA